MYFTTIQRAMCTILPDLVKYTYSRLFVNKNVSLGCIKLLCTHDFSRVSFAAELSTNLVHIIVFLS